MGKSTLVLLILLAGTIIFATMTAGQLGRADNLLAVANLEKAQLSTDLNTLKTQINSLQRDLNSTKSELATTNTLYSDSQQSLQANRAELTFAQSDLKTTKSDLSTARQSLTDIRAQLTLEQSKVRSAEAANSQMRNQYADLRDAVNARWDWHEHATEYITPNNPEVIAKAHYLAGDFADTPDDVWMDYNRMYNWVESTVEYQDDSPVAVLPYSLSGSLEWSEDCWKTPEETLASLTGDCEDMAALLASLMLAYNKDSYAVWAIGIRSSETGHLAVGFPVAGGEFSIADPAGHYFTGIKVWTTLAADPIDRCINDWLAAWTRDMPGAYVDSVFADDFFLEFSSTQEFINWVKTR